MKSDNLHAKEPLTECMLADIASIQTGPFGSQLHSRDYVKNGIPIVTVEHLGQRRFSEQNLPNVSLSDAERLSKYYLQEGDIVFSRVGSVDRCAYVFSQNDGWLFSGRCLRVRSRGVCSLFLYYYLSSREVREYVASVAVGATMPSINTSIMGEIKLNIPYLPTQRKIAAVLSSLDDKIETNNAICRNLEEQMETLYGAFVGKKAWKKANIGELAERVAMGPFGSNIKVSTFVDEGVPIISGNHLRGKFVEDCDFNFITESHAQKLNRSLVHAGDIVFTHAGTLGQVAMVPDDTDYGEYIISQRQFFLRCNQEKALPLFVLLFFHSKWGQWQLLSYANQTGVPSIAQPATNLKKIEIPLPPINAQKEWAKCVQPLVDEFRALWQQKRRLAALRDTLLPRLMSGELDVSAVKL